MEIKIDMTKARLVFDWRFRPLVINPRESERFDVHAVPLSRVIDESGDSEAVWFAFFEEDCFDPPIYIVRAESWEQAYEDFLDTRPDADLSDWSDEERAEFEAGGNHPDGYSFTSDGRIVYSEAVMGYEIELKEVNP